MDRREFLTTGMGAVGAACVSTRPQADSGLRPGAEVRGLFPGLEDQTFLNAAGGTPPLGR